MDALYGSFLSHEERSGVFYVEELVSLSAHVEPIIRDI